MATFNKDLSPIDQARIILRNYDKVVAERDELKKGERAYHHRISRQWGKLRIRYTL